MTLLTTHNPMRPMAAATARELMEIFIDQDTDALLVGACLALLAQRTPTAEELDAFASALAAVAVPFPDPGLPVLDVVGTGGDARKSPDGSPRATANLSTLAALLLADLGVPVLKHGNRAATGVCGSADLLEALGYDLTRPPEALREDLRQGRFAFLFAPAYHPLLGRLREIRKRLGIPTIFNLLGPLLNPGRPAHLLLGVAREELLMPMAGALARRGVVRAFVVHGKDAEGQGLDEASIEGPTRIVEVQGGAAVEAAVLVPRELGLRLPAKDALTVGDRAEALRLALGFHGGSAHADFVPALADAVALQAGLGLLLHRDLPLAALAGALGEARTRLDQGFPLPLPHLLEGA
ncbi:MAG: anthranilate phosphoribosyltransferase [Holophagaceae bacterium]|nr:anthranilate phosphoribosyltransferase [Holophagaceae bacterium]